MSISAPAARLAAACIVAALPSVAAAQQKSPEDAAVRAAINQYFKGHATADGAEMRKAFLPTAHIEGIREGKFVSWTVEEYSSRFTGKPAADEATRKRSIDSIHVSGTAAMAQATLVHGATTFTDSFVLRKVAGAWRLANTGSASRPTR